MVSYLIRGDSLMDQISDIYYYLHSKKPILRTFAQKLSTLEELPDVVQENKYESLTRNVKSLGSDKFQKKFQKLYDQSYNDLLSKNEENGLSSVHETIKKLFILGGKNVGKTTFLNQVKAVQSNLNESTDLATKIFEVIIDNVEELRAECYNDLLKCDQCEINNRCITQAQGFIIIFNNSDRESISEAKERFNIIHEKFCKYNPDKAIPILLIGNKLQKNKEVKTTTPPNEWNIEKAKGCNIITKHIDVDLTNGGDRLQKSFRWIIKQLI
jgi:GTPase SAR1 family protein